MSEAGKKLRTFEARVVSDKMDKTAVVVITRRVKHATGKVISKRTRLKIHDEHNECGMGDWVSIAESTPYSKDKSWRLVAVLVKHED